MGKRLAKDVTSPKLTEEKAPQSVGISTQSKSKALAKKTQSSSQKSIGRKEKMEAIRKANQAMMEAWKLISLRANIDG